MRPDQQGPQAVLKVTPLVGAVRQPFKLDASASTDTEQETRFLQYCWDTDGDGAWDTRWSAEPTLEISFTKSDTLTVSVAVRDAAGETDVASAEIRIGIPPSLMVRADPDSGDVDTEFTFIGTGTRDPRGRSLEFRWDLDGDGSWDTDWDESATIRNQYDRAGIHRFGMAARNADGFERSVYRTLNVWPHQVWIVPGSGWTSTSPTLAPDGSVLVGDDQGALHAFDTDGSELWSLDLAAGYARTPSMLPDGRIAFVSGEGYLNLLSSSGSLLWTAPLGTNSLAALAVGPDTTLYASTAGGLEAFDIAGGALWPGPAGGNITQAPVVKEDGTIIVVNASGDLLALDSDGSVLWGASPGGAIYSAPAVGYEGEIYVGTEDGTLVRLTASGTEEWRLQLPSASVRSIVIGTDGTVYAASHGPRLTAVHPDGAVFWSCGFPGWDGNPTSTSVVTADGAILVPTVTGLWCVGPDGTIRWKLATDNAYGGVALAEDGRVIAWESNGRIICLQTTLGGLARSPWPKAGADAGNTGLWRILP